MTSIECDSVGDFTPHNDIKPLKSPTSKTREDARSSISPRHSKDITKDA